MNTLDRRFWEKVDILGDNDCWEWRASTTRQGYGRIHHNRKAMLAHRVSWLLHYGEIPTTHDYHGTCVLHNCDNPPCVNPRHLFLGTQADNLTDMTDKGRRGQPNPPPPIGEKNGNSKLTESDVLLIRRYLTVGKWKQKTIAKLFGVCKATITGIKNRQRWAHT